MSDMICAHCCLWSNEDPYDGKTSENFCAAKDLYAFTKPTHECDEMMIGGGYYFSEKDNENPDTYRP